MRKREPVLQIADVTKTFGTVRAVDNVSLEITAGEVVALLGHNGAGKSTLLDMVLGLNTPDSGRITLLGGTPEEAVRKQRISAMMRSGGMLSDLSVKETLQIVAAASPKHVPVPEVIERAGLGSFASRKVAKCSGGQIQRLRFGLALLPDPEVLLLDEPTAGLDAQAREEFWDSMEDLAHGGKTIVFATHYLREADRYAERVVIMKQGRITTDGTLAELMATRGARISGELLLADPASLMGALGVEQWHVEDGKTLVVEHPESDRIAKTLLNEAAVKNLRITRPEVEDLFFEFSASGAHHEHR